MLLVRDIVDFVAPNIRKMFASKCSPWPPDVFVVAATLLRRTGAYVRVVELRKSGRKALLPSAWPAEARRLGFGWRGTFRIRRGTLTSRPPDEVNAWWRTLLRAAASDVPVADVVGDDVVCSAILKLALVADEASQGIGTETSGDVFEEWAQFRLAVNKLASVGWQVSPDRGCVLPKQHTPQRGMTLRSLTHHLGLLPPSDVRVAWHPPIPRANSKDRDLINLLLLPWPTEVKPGDFRIQAGEDASILPQKYRYFAFSKEGQPRRTFETRLKSAIAAAARCAGHIDGIVFPELALSWTEYKAAASIARGLDLLLIAGVRLDDRDARVTAPTNACLFELPGELTDRIVQKKHHRWCLDRSQILQYGLGGVLPGSLDCWEYTEIGERSVSFVTLGGWMTLTALICEDLARQDPVADILRTVGPNLVVALLMDGPQLRGRWSSRYASVLSEDPGSSVLTVTSLGMSTRSRPASGQVPRSRVVALWRDVQHGEIELELPDECEAAVLSLSRESIEEFSADARGDGATSHFPVFAGFHPLDLTRHGATLTSVQTSGRSK